MINSSSIFLMIIRKIGHSYQIFVAQWSCDSYYGILKTVFIRTNKQK